MEHHLVDSNGGFPQTCRFEQVMVRTRATSITEPRVLVFAQHMTKLGMVVHRENIVPPKSTEMGIKFQFMHYECGRVVHSLHLLRQSCARTAKDSFCVHEIVELAVSCLLRNAFSVSDAVLLPIPSFLCSFLLSDSPQSTLRLPPRGFQGSQYHSTSYH